MMMGKEDLSLSLSLGFAQTHHPHKLMNLKPTSSPISNLQMFPWNQTFVSSSDHQSQQLFTKINVNSLPVDLEEETGVSSPNSTISSNVSGKRRSEREGTSGGAGDDLDVTLDRSSSRGTSEEEEEEYGGEACRKKLRLSKDQSAVLEDTFKEHNTLNPKQKLALAKKLGLTARQVEVWFQNRRARTKLKQTEVDCEYLKRCVEKLTEENIRLEKEAAELRALKLSPRLYGHMSPPTTLLMCPSCERVAGPSNHNQRSVSLSPWLQMAHGSTFDVVHPRS
ncbi:homeobox-leucine zipper protein HAT1 isoform X2 [Brassica rapa]|uniref:homeobox-leucine zipper protein HAT1 isoform X2 n=1 Tax=Brassica campestris TaxID=3711 RepID=UPI0004F1BD8F|nr:homeobox-leucine zipper protein HAT1 isoform X2 [Brassica rapa]